MIKILTLIITYRVSQKNVVYWKKKAITTLKLIQNAKVGVFWKIQDISYNMGTEIFKTVEEMTDNEA